jgi:hypothetical protein
MALLGPMIDKRTLAGLISNTSATFTHGLGGVPNSVAIRYIVALASSTNFSVGGVDSPVDVTGVTLRNSGFTTVPDMEIVTMRVHSLIS